MPPCFLQGMEDRFHFVEGADMRKPDLIPEDPVSFLQMVPHPGGGMGVGTNGNDMACSIWFSILSLESSLNSQCK